MVIGGIGRSWLAALCLGLLMVGSVPAASLPNIVLILADDLGYGDLGCYGNTLHRTPHIDALARNGLKFSDFHSSGPMCTPTRAATLTGLYQQRFGRKFDTAISGVSHRNTGLPHGAVTLAEKLKARGHATACLGKWHLGYQPPFLPPNQGFDVFWGLGSGDGDFHTRIDRSGNEDWWKGNVLEEEEGYTTELITRHSEEFIREHRKGPFFLYVPHLAIHFPWQGPEDPPHRQKGVSYHQDKWGVIPDPSNVAPHVKAMVEALDQSVGRIVTCLEEQGIRDNTLIVFSSDNGGYLTYGDRFSNISSNGPLRGQKTQVYEGGHRVPTIFNWPGRVRKGVTDALTHSTDLFPTLCRLAGIPHEDVTSDGMDLWPLLAEGTGLPDRTLFWRAGKKRAVREGRWKLCQEGRELELFDLAKDLGEQNNLADLHPEKVALLLRKWEQWEREVNASAKRFEQP